MATCCRINILLLYLVHIILLNVFLKKQGVSFKIFFVFHQQENETEENADTNQKAPVWHKQKKQPKKKGGNQKNKKAKQAYNWKAAATTQDKKESSKQDTEKQVRPHNKTTVQNIDQ